MKKVDKVKAKGTPKAGSSVGVCGDNKAKKEKNYVDASMMKKGKENKWNKDVPNNTGGPVNKNILKVKEAKVNGNNYAK